MQQPHSVGFSAPPQYGQQAPSYGQQAPVYNQPAPVYGQPTPVYDETMPQVQAGYGQPMPQGQAYGQPMKQGYGGQPVPYGQNAPHGQSQPSPNAIGVMGVQGGMDLSGIQRRRGGGGVPWPILLCFIPIFWCAFGGGGIALRIVGEDNLEKAEALDPEYEFLNLKLACTISKVIHTTEMEEFCVDSRQNGNNEECDRWADLCVDTYVHYFIETIMKGSSDEMEYKGDTRSQTRQAENVVCENGVPESIPSSWPELDEVINCWKPNVPVADIPKSENCDGTSDVGLSSVGYMCCNDQCWKMNDPVDEAKGHVESAKALMIVGVVLAGIGGVIFMCWLNCLRLKFS